MKFFFIPLLLISVTAVGQINQSPVINPKIKKVKVLNFESFTGLYATAAVGDSWESTIINNRKDEIVSPSLGPITYERVSIKNLAGAGSVEAGLGYSFGNNLSAEVTYDFKANAAGSETTTGAIFYSGGSRNFKGETKISGKINKHSFVANLFYDVPTKTRWVPFVGAGLGLARVTSTDMIYNFNVVYSNGDRAVGTRTETGGIGNSFVYQAKIGIDYLLSNKTALFLYGKYYRINSVDLGGGTVYEGFNIYGAKVGFIYRFAKKRSNSWGAVQ
jgi:opacity protein-like surface antigen